MMIEEENFSSKVKVYRNVFFFFVHPNSLLILFSLVYMLASHVREMKRSSVEIFFHHINCYLLPSKVLVFKLKMSNQALG